MDSGIVAALISFIGGLIVGGVVKHAHFCATHQVLKSSLEIRQLMSSLKMSPENEGVKHFDNYIEYQMGQVWKNRENDDYEQISCKEKTFLRLVSPEKNGMLVLGILVLIIGLAFGFCLGLYVQLWEVIASGILRPFFYLLKMG